MKKVPSKKSDHWLDPFEELQHEMNSLFSKRMGVGMPSEVWAPEVDINDEKDRIVMTVEIPGIKKNQIDVVLDDGFITIKGEKKHKTTKKKNKYIRNERYSGSFERSFALPSIVDTSKIKANCNQGVLKIVLPKKKNSQKKQANVPINY